MILEAYERHRVLKIAWNVVKRPRLDLNRIRRVLDWLEENMDILRVPIKLRNLFEVREDVAPNKLWSEVSTFIEREANTKKVIRPGILETHIQRIGELFGLDSLEKQILGLVISYRNNEVMESIVDIAGGYLLGGHNELARLLGIRQIELQRRLHQKARLIATGLLELNIGSRRVGEALQVSDSLMKAIAPPRKNHASLREALLGVPGQTDLDWLDFDHVSTQRDLLLRVLGGAAECNEPGVNILVYGPPGTGKTEFCKVVAAQLGVEIYPVGETDDDGGEPNRRERLQSLRMVQMLLERQDNALVLFDEMEDVFALSPDSDWRSQSRVFIHRMLESNPRPILWTCNHIGSFDAAILRRMSMVIEIKTPTPKVRERVWSRVIARQQLKLPAEEIGILSREFEAPPALAANAARSARLAGGGWDDIRVLVQGVNKVLMGRHTHLPKHSEHPFDPDLAHASLDLKDLADRLEHSKSTQFSLCLSGPSGTGKSAYARYLAERMGMPVIQKRTSDLISKWLGDSEKAIAEAFEQAKEEGAMLIFDEADSLLSDRRDAQRSWEVSQVNEMLTWMESHPLPFICTTNLMERLDLASLRRFTFKLKFDYLTPEKVCKAFLSFFGAVPLDETIRKLDHLTPGDFSLVARKAKIISTGQDHVEVVKMLAEENASKLRSPSSQIGFQVVKTGT